jgi:hypothetical protein
MAESLSPECTPLKHEYDGCFNSWFAGYLEPAVHISASTKKVEEKTREYAVKKAEEYERKCGKIWEEYRNCLEVWSLPCCMRFMFAYGTWIYFPFSHVRLNFPLLLTTLAESGKRQRTW